MINLKTLTPLQRAMLGLQLMGMHWLWYGTACSEHPRNETSEEMYVSFIGTQEKGG